jgi:hypothetical protein
MKLREATDCLDGWHLVERITHQSAEIAALKALAQREQQLAAARGDSSARQ